MSDYQPTEQDKVLLDYAQTAQRRADPWVEFQYLHGVAWFGCNHARHPGATHHDYRRKPRTVTLLDLPIPNKIHNDVSPYELTLYFKNPNNTAQWVAALREIDNVEDKQ